MDKLINGLGIAILSLAILCVIGIIVALPLMLLWNWLLPDLFNIPEISFWQALGMFLLTGILFRTSSSSKD